MKALKLTPKEKEIFEQLKSTPGGGITQTRQGVGDAVLSTSRCS